MKNYTRILIMMILSSLFIISSCKKEEGPTIEGCTDSTAMNYNSNATSNNGSCKYAYIIAQGVWNISSDCDDLPIPIPGLSLDDLLPESIEVEGAGNNTLFLDIDGAQVTGSIDNDGNIIANEQTVQVDFGLGIPVDVQVSGSGKIESENTGYMNLSYAFQFQGFPLSTSCYITLSR